MTTFPPFLKTETVHNQCGAVIQGAEKDDIRTTY